MKTNPLTPISHRPDEEPIVCIPINKYWLAALSAMIYPYRYPEAWLGTLEENQQARADVLEILFLLMDMEDCETMACCDGSDLLITVITRVDVTGKIEISIDNGDTWHRSPNDPRTLIPQIPPYTSDPTKTKCDAATNGLEKLQDVQAGISAKLALTLTLLDFLVSVLEVIMAAILLTLGQAKLIELVPLIGAFFRALYGHNQEEYDALFTSEVWDAVLCILYCNASPDGTYTEGQFANVLADCLTKIPGGDSDFAAPKNIQAMLKVWGREGLNYAVSEGNAADADCDSCECSSCDFSTWVCSVGNIVEQQTDFITIDAVVHEGSTYAAAIHGSGFNDCCCNITYEVLSGPPPDVVAYCPCGLNYDDSANFGYAYTGQQADYLSCTAGSAFRVKFATSGPCV